MTNIEYVEHSIDLFEDSLKAGESRPCVSSLKAVAQKIGYNPHYLSRLFQGVCGMPMGQYMIKRRLTEAYLRIRDTGQIIKDISLDLGWEDYSSFSRAFKNEFSISASAVRSVGFDNADKRLTYRLRPVNPAYTGFSREPLIQRLDALHISGLVFHMDGSEKTFPRPWRIYAAHQHRLHGTINPNATYQCSFWPDDGPTEGMWILCGKETEPSAVQEAVFFSKLFPELSVLTFRHTGPVESIFHTYAYIWGEYLPGSVFRPAGNFEFQRYTEDQNFIEILLPVIM